MGKDSPSDQAYKHQPIRPIPIRSKKKPIKIKYIPSPVTVIARDASEFRAMVQNLTGADSIGASSNSRTRKEGKVQVYSHDITTPHGHPQSDIALDDTMPSWLSEQQTHFETETLESVVKILSQQ